MQEAQQLLHEANVLANEHEHTKAVDLALLALERDISHELKLALHERISISGFYSKNPQHKTLGHASCDFIASDRTSSWARKNAARQNFTWYASSLKELAPSTFYKQILITPDDNYRSTNPSISSNGTEIWMIQRTVNYVIRPDGSYDMQGDSAIRTRNYLCKLDDNLNIISQNVINLPEDLPPPKYNLVVGFEDSRLFFWEGQPWCTSTVRELTDEGWCEIVLAKITDTGSNNLRLTDWRAIRPNFTEKQHEKNWMPLVIDNNLYFIYSNDPTRIIDSNGNLINSTQSSIAVDSYRGGGPAVAFDGGYLALIHESHGMPYGKRRYTHRFVWYDRWGRLAKQSQGFYIMKLGIEFSPGLAKHPNKDSIIISFGVEDRESWLAELSCDDIRSILTYAGIDKEKLADDVDTMTMIFTEINKALSSSEKVRQFKNIAIRSGLPLHEDVQKNWDNVLATYWATLVCDNTNPVLDVAATPGSAFLPGLRMLGFKNLMSINLTQEQTEIKDGITYLNGDCTATNFDNDYFGFVSCLSVIEHGVDVEKFLAESYRILKPKGYLFVSTDYWDETVDTHGQMAFGAPVKVFNMQDIENIISAARLIGFKCVSNYDLSCQEKTVEWIGMQYTFFNLLLQKK